MSLTNWNILGISVENWSLAVGIGVAAYLIISIVISFLTGRLAAIAQKTTGRFDDVAVEVLTHTNRVIIFLIAVLIGLSVIDLPMKWDARLSHGWVIAIGLQIALWLNRGINVWMRGYDDRATNTIIVFILRFVIWLTAILAVLANLGVNITAFVASLGIGGIAVALAVQNILSDLFASMSIALDKPFEIGDFIIVDDMLGTVEHIGIKTTRIRSLSGEQVISSNAELLKRTIRNYKRMAERRAVFAFGIGYQTSASQAAALPDAIKSIIGGIAGTRFDRAHFKQFGDSALEYEVVYYVLDPDFNLYMDIQQRINLELMQACAQREIEFAYPTRTLHIASVPASIGSAEQLPALPDAEKSKQPAS